MLVKILGAIDVAAAVIFLMLIFGMSPFLQFTLFCAGLLLLKSAFILTGEPLSAIDLVSGILLICSIFFTLPSIVVWVPAFLLLAKGFVSFF